MTCDSLKVEIVDAGGHLEAIVTLPNVSKLRDGRIKMSDLKLKASYGFRINDELRRVVSSVIAEYKVTGCKYKDIDDFYEGRRNTFQEYLQCLPESDFRIPLYEEILRSSVFERFIKDRLR